MVVAGTPAKQAQSSPEIPRWAMLVAEALADGQTVAQIAQRIAKGDARKAKNWRRRIRNLAWSDTRMKAALAAAAQAEMNLGLPAAAAGVSRRAGRGRTDSAKLLFGATGFYNEKVDHSHSGEIQINVSIPRPKATEDHIPGPGIEEGFVDADVVEE